MSLLQTTSPNKIMSKTKPQMIRCAICNGTGIEEETMKGYRRYKCRVCKGTKQVEHPFPQEENNEKENKQIQNPERI